MINFDSLPKANPFALPTPDCYKAKITGVEMKQGNDKTKPPYLNVKLALTSKSGKGAGNVFDIISESDSSVVQYKLARFVRACGIPLQGQMMLKDIGALVLNKEIAVDISIAKGAEKSPGSGDFYADKAQVDIFKNEAYYMISEFDQAYANYHINDDFKASTVTGNEDFMNVGEDEEVPFDNSEPDTPAQNTESAPTEY